MVELANIPALYAESLHSIGPTTEVILTKSGNLLVTVSYPIAVIQIGIVLFVEDVM